MKNAELYIHKEVHGYGQMLLNTNKISNVLVQKPDCEFIVKGTLGCTGCTSLTSVYFETTKLNK